MENQEDSMRPGVPIVAIMGVTGSGKSRFVQMATGLKIFIGDDLTSCND